MGRGKRGLVSASEAAVLSASAVLMINTRAGATRHIMTMPRRREVRDQWP